MNCPLISEINPISGSFTWKATSSNASSNIITGININNALTYSNDAEYLGDLSVFGEIENVGISALSNFCLVNYSNLNLLSNNNSSFSNDIYNKSTSNINNLTTLSDNIFSFSNDIYPKYTYTNNAVIFSSNTSLFSSNLVITVSNDIYPKHVFNSNIAVFSSNNLSNVSTTLNYSSLSNNLTSNNYYSYIYNSNLNSFNSNSIITTNNFNSNLNIYNSNQNIFNYSNIITQCNFSVTNTNFNSNLNIYNSNQNIYNSNLNIFNSNNIITQCNFSVTNTNFNSNLNIYHSNQNLYNSNLNIFNSNNINTQSNYNKTTYLYCSNLEFFTSNISVFSSNLCIFNSNNNSNYTTSNILFPLINSNTTRSVFSSNYLSNCRILSTLVPWSQVSGKPDFSSDGAGNDAIGISGVTIGSAGLLMSGYALLDKNGKLTNALSDAFGKMTIDPSGYFKLNDPGSYIDIGDSTTRVSKDRLLFKTGTFSNMILNPANLSYSNGIFSLCNQIALTATSISNLTHVSCSSNLTVLGVSSNGITAVGNNPLYLGDGNKGLIYSGALSTYNSNFTSTDGPVLYGWNGSSLASAAPGYGENFAIRQSNLTGIAYWTSSGLGVFRSNPVVPLDVVGFANISGSLSTSTHSNSGNLQSSYVLSSTHSNTSNMNVAGTLNVCNGWTS
jgi:hypothetical protein